jgi:hypothetical protein
VRKFCRSKRVEQFACLLQGAAIEHALHTLVARVFLGKGSHWVDVGPLINSGQFSRQATETESGVVKECPQAPAGVRWPIG